MAKGKEIVSIVWFRADLRLADNPALQAAIDQGSVLPVFIWSPEEEGAWPPGAACKWWLHQSLAKLETSLGECGSQLILQQGPSAETLVKIARQTGAKTVFWNRRYEPASLQQDAQVEKSLKDAGLATASFNSSLLFEPWVIKNKSGKPFQVFTPFWKTCLAAAQIPKPLPKPSTIPSPKRFQDSLPLESLKLQPTLPWAKGLAAHWSPGEVGAHLAVKRFCKSGLAAYQTARNLPAQPGTSSLSAHLHFGEISPRQIWQKCQPAISQESNNPLQNQFLTELGWREFAHHLLYHFPHTPTEPLRKEFTRFPWRRIPEQLKAWQKGQTGYPLVDAGMRQLWAIGWMHNRVRMIVASFLVKDLLLSWQEGAAWFWDTLVDADLANNTLGWQWTAGCGADAAPFFRIFNPVSQGEKFDPDGDFVRHWVPELAKLPARWIHCPWEAPEQVLTNAGVRLGQNYPERIVSHSIAREVALEAFQKLKSSR